MGGSKTKEVFFLWGRIDGFWDESVEAMPRPKPSLFTTCLGSEVYAGSKHHREHDRFVDEIS